MTQPTGFIDQLLPWADAHSIGYVGWAWNTGDCASGPSLISRYDGTPTAFGTGYENHLANSATVTVTPSPTPVSTSALFDFEDGGTDGWFVGWGTRLGRAPGHRRRHVLAP